MVGGVVEVIVAPAYALIARFEQVLTLVHHAKAKVAIHCDDKFGSVIGRAFQYIG
jgi:hypothetical protein